MATVTKTVTSTIECIAKLLNDINNDNGIVPVCQTIRVDAEVNLTFTFSAPLSTAEDTQLDTLITNLVCDISAVSTTTDQIEGCIFPVTFSYGSSIHNKWLSHPGETSIPSDDTQAIVPFNSKLVGIVFSNKRNNANADIEVHVAPFGSGSNESNVLTWQLRSIRSARKTNFSSEILFLAGDKIGIYCKRPGSMKHPKDVVVILYLQITDINSEEQTENYSGDF